MKQFKVDLPQNNPAFSAAYAAAKTLTDAGFHAWLVGGCVRDLVRSQTPKDCDVCTDATPEEIRPLFPHTYDVGAAFGVVIVMIDSIQIEIATLREERGTNDGRHPENLYYTTDPHKDACRRDFTINAFYLCAQTGVVTDYFTGVEDLASGVIRSIGKSDARFNEDYLRMLRAVRFAARMDFQIEADTFQGIIRNAKKVRFLSAERIRSELCLMLKCKQRVRAIELLDQSALLGEILPELTALHGVTQNPRFHPEGDVWVHTLKALSCVSDDAPEEAAWAVLLHDIGKVATYSKDENGDEHFYNHETVSGELTREILQRLKFDNKTADIIFHAVVMHMRFAAPQMMRKSKLRHIIAADYFPTLLEVIRADSLGCHGDCSHVQKLQEIAATFQTEPALPPPFLTGKDLIDRGLKPGVEFGCILKDFYARQLDGDFVSRQDALDAFDKKPLNV